MDMVPYHGRVCTRDRDGSDRYITYIHSVLSQDRMRSFSNPEMVEVLTSSTATYSILHHVYFWDMDDVFF